VARTEETIGGQPRSVPVTIAGRRIDAIELPGDDRLAPIVMLHEGLGSVDLWRDFPSALHRATGRRVIAFSRFGHGRSEPSPWPRDAVGFHHREALELLPRLLAALGVHEPLLVGHSDGASVALIHAGRHPVCGLVLLAPHVFVEPLTLASIRQTRDSYLRGELRERMARHHDDVDAAFWGWCDMWLHPDFRAWNLEGDAALVTVPTLLIQGADDPYGTLEQLDRIEARIRGPVSRLVVPGGHSPHLAAPDQVVAAVARFASDTPCGSDAPSTSVTL
jgi:pimeloyl-ACP methyl ester carboxylesterase